MSLSRSVWENVDKRQQHDTESRSTSALSLHIPNLGKQSSKLYASQDSVYHSCWSLSGLAHDADESVVKTSSNPEVVPTEYSARESWSNQLEKKTSQRSIWSPALPNSAGENVGGIVDAMHVSPTSEL